MRIALFGGSFNPPHVAHQLVGLTVLETRPVDELWLVPTFKHPFDKALVPFEHRYRMCELSAAALGPRARVSDVEQRLGGDSRTLRTVQHLQAERPADEFLLVVGADLLGELDTWYGAAELKRTVPLIVIGRAGFGVPLGDEGPPLAMPAVSSTEVREALAQGGPVAQLVPRTVLDYIYRHRLYGARPHDPV